MRTQVLILVFLICVNVVAYGVMTTTVGGGDPMFPFVQYTQPMNETGNIDDYDENFNGTATVEAWEPSGSYGFAGDIFSGLNMFWNMFRFIAGDGFAQLLDWVGSFIPAANTAFAIFSTILRVIMGVMMVTLVIEFITGRSFFD